MFIDGAGDTSNVVYFKLRDAATGAAKTGLVFNSAGAVCSYTRPKSAAVAITLVTQTPTGAWTSGGFCEVDSVLAPGLYRLDLPDGACAAGVGYSIITLGFGSTLVEQVEVLLDPLPDVISFTVQADAGNSSSAFKTNLPSLVANFYKDAWVQFRTGNLAGQGRQISAYSGGTAIITLGNALTAVPAAGDTGVVQNR